jgi:hypothetical protein
MRADLSLTRVVPASYIRQKQNGTVAFNYLAD